MVNKIILTVLLLFLMSSCVLQNRITKEEAIFLAERFVIEHGYAHQKIDFDSVRTKFDVIEYDLSKDQIIEFRYNSLIPKAVYARKYALGKWLIGFDGASIYYSSLSQDTTTSVLRAVIVSGNGEKIHLEHQGYIVKKEEMIEK